MDENGPDADAINRALGETLAEARREAGLTQQDIASRLAVHQGAISRWEAGTRSLTVPLLFRLYTELPTLDVTETFHELKRGR